MKKIFVFMLCAAALLSNNFSATAATPDEGMWLPMYLKQFNEAQMKARGFRLTADDIYDINQACLKDAIVSLGGFCTAELVSKQGLLFTNHHCGYDAIAALSTPTNDLLTNGFWAYNNAQELPADGLTASVLVRMEDVTAQVKQGLKDGKKMPEISKNIQDEATKSTGYNARVQSIFNGNQYIISVYETFKDVRLVGTPPSAIGKFGGDTDNWMWPRHTGDFSIFRVYADKNNQPAAYSKDNQPYAPKRHLKVSTNGINEGDYTMIMGYPGRTNRYATGAAIESNLEYFNKSFVDLYEIKMTAMKAAMDADNATRLNLASDYASGMNTYKYYIGQTLGLKQGGLVDKKNQSEKQFEQWVATDPARTEKYGNALTTIRKMMAEYGPTNRKFLYYAIGLGDTKFIATTDAASDLNTALTEGKDAGDAAKATLEKVDGLFANYSQIADENTFAGMLNRFYENINKAEHPAIFATILSKYKGANAAEKFKNYAKTLYATSVFVNEDRMKAFLENPNAKVLKKDLGYQFAQAIEPQLAEIGADRGKKQATIADAQKLYVEGMMEMQSDRSFYPDANSTLRVSYGNVMSYVPRDAVSYKYFTTLDGIMEKEDPKNEEFIVPAKLKEIYMKKDYGRYAENGTVPVGFLSNNDITGGNSGSPVLNADGDLIGLAFDGNWEAMTGDLMFSNEKQRTISVDIRYVLLIVEKLGGAKNIIDELDFAAPPRLAPVKNN
jgi:hypothetical protein